MEEQEKYNTLGGSNFYGPYYSIDEIIDDLKDNVSIHTIIARLELAKKNGYDLIKEQKEQKDIGYWNCATDITY